MMNYDFSPLFRSTVGFDRVFDLLDQASRGQPMGNWPPYNIERADEDHYRITMALAGFSPDEIELVQQANVLVVAGQKHPDSDSTQLLHRGIATRAFKQTFDLADHVKVTGASLENGLLVIELQREVPEALKPRRIEIGAGGGQKAIAQDNKSQTEKTEAA